mgnify:CR=1 FL=1
MARKGIRKSSAIITVAAAATAENLYLLTVGGAVTRSVILKKIWAYSAIGNCIVTIGTGLAGAFAAIIPPMLVLNGMDNTWTEEDIPEREMFANLTIQSSVLGVQVQVEVEEIGF